MAIACACVAAAAFVLALAAGRASHFNPDESRWISRSHYLADLTNPWSPTWDDQYMTRGQPPLGSYAMGLALLLQGRDLHTNPPWDFALSWEVNVAIGNKPAPADLAAGRAASAALTAMTALAVIAVAHNFASIRWAIVAGALYAIHPFSIYIGSIAMADALFGLLIIVAAAAAAALARRPGQGRALTLGIVLGLGAATKLSPLAVAGGLTLAIALIAAVSAFRQRCFSAAHRARTAEALLVGAAAIATFMAIYPYLWPDPIGRTQRLFSFRTEEMAAQAADWPVMAVPNRLEALRRVHANFGDRYNLSDALATWAGFGPTPDWVRQLEIVVAIFGVAILIARALRAGLLSPPAFALAVIGGQVAVTILGMRSEFDRYHLPMALLGVIAAAAALECLTSNAVRRLPRALLIALGRLQSAAHSQTGGNAMQSGHRCLGATGKDP
jgi:hypothetical protein